MALGGGNGRSAYVVVVDGCGLSGTEGAETSGGDRSWDLWSLDSGWGRW